MSGLEGAEAVTEAVRARYGRLASGGCCSPQCCGEEAGAPSYAEMGRSIGYSEEDLLSLPESANLGLGCGNPTAIADLALGEVVLDLGSGAGIDCFLAAERVGPTGRVIGVDMTPEMVARARRSATAGGYANVEFRLGEIEALPVPDGSVDVILSNCVLNLSSSKERALSEAHRVLRPGGRLVISDMVSDVPVPPILAGSVDAAAGCLPTARDRYLEHFRASGFQDVRIVDERPYPPTYILADPGVRAFLDAHPDSAGGIEAFARSIRGAHFTATKAG